MEELKKAFDSHNGMNQNYIKTTPGSLDFLPQSLENNLEKITFDFEQLLKIKEVVYRDLKNKKGRYGYFLVSKSFLKLKLDVRVLLKNIKILRTYYNWNGEEWVVLFKFRLFSKYYFKLKKVYLRHSTAVIFELEKQKLKNSEKIIIKDVII